MKKLLLTVVALAFSIATYAQETVTLVVNGEGATKEEATANALRSAIEQSFGVFVSANTQILNDEIVKDEIATIASGNIKEYKELGTVTMPDGRKSISLSATVSIKNLISYAQSKGSSTEFAGAVWGMNIKIRKLNAENERMAINHLLEQLDILSRDMFKIELSTPNPPVKINWDDYKYSHLKKSYSSQPYFLDFNLTYYPTSACTLFFDLLNNMIPSIALSDDEVKAYKESGEPLYELRLGYDDRNGYYTVGLDPYYTNAKYYFRTDIVETITSSIYVSIRNALLSQWQIVRSSTDKGEEPITFKTLAPKDRYWKSYPQNRVIEWPTAPLIKNYSNRYINIGFFPNMMNGDETQITTFTIKIGYTEEELSKTTGFEITKREDFDVDNVQPRNEIWCTFSRFSRDLRDRCEAPGGAYTYSIKNKCWIRHSESDVTTINEYNGGHYHCADLTSISIPNSVTEIGSSAFRGCTGLTSITIPNSVTSIGHYAFEDCTGLTSITIPDLVTKIGEGAFSGCTGLTSISIPNSVTSIGYYAFRGCTGLTSITIPDSVTSIGYFAFEGCTGLTSITISNIIQTIWSDAFKNTSQECIAYVPMGSAGHYKYLLSRAGFSGRVVEMSPNTHASNQIIEEEKTKVYSNSTVEVGAETPDSNTDEPIPFQLVEEKPSFQGGDANQFSKWVNQSLVYPEIAKANGVQGRVTLQFTIEKDGSITNVTVLRGVDPSLDKEAVRVVSMSPKWTPGKQKDRAVPVTYTFPLNFQLSSYQENISNTHASNPIIKEEKTKVYSNSYDGYTNIRETPSLKGKIIGELRNGPDGAVLISKTEGWSKINCNGVEGYVYTKNLSTSPTEEVTISTDINWINGIWRNDNEQYAYLIFSNGTFAIQSTSGTLAYGTYMLKGNDIEFSIKQFLSSMEISKIQRHGIDTATNRIGQLRKRDFLSESEQYNNTYDLTWTKSQFNALKKEIRALL